MRLVVNAHGMVEVWVREFSGSHAQWQRCIAVLGPEVLYQYGLQIVD